MKILVTGGSGFLGGALSRRLVAEGHQVTVMNRSAVPGLTALGVQWIPADLADASRVWPALQGCDAVFHAAADTRLMGPYRRYRRNNIQSTWNVVEGCLAEGVPRLVYTSSPSVVFDQSSLEGSDESLPYPDHHLSPYAASKAEAEQLVLRANGKQGLATLALRPHLIYGPGDRQLVPKVLRRAARRRLVQVGDGQNQVDLTYIDNAVEAHCLALQRLLQGPPAGGRAYFISDGAPVKLWDWIKSLLHQLDLPPVSKRLSLRPAYILGAMFEPFWKIPGMPGDPPMTRFLALQLAESHFYNIAAARRDLGYEPPVSPSEGFRALVAHLQTEGY